MPTVELRDVSKSFGGHDVLRSVTLTIEAGRIYGLTGRNGSGKSVLLQTICGLVRPDSGEISYDPEYVPDGRVFPDWFGVMINGPAYVSSLSAMQNLRDLAAIRKRSTDEDLRAMLRSVGLDPDSRKRVRSYSSGMKQKLGLAQAFIESPRVLVLDEPFNALDETTVAVIKAMLLEFNERGVTIVFSSHSESDFTDLATDMIDLIDGTVSLRSP